MTLIERIRHDAVAARRNKAGGPEASVLVALLGEIDTKTKSFNPARPITDAEIVAIVKRFLDGAAETETVVSKLPDGEKRTAALTKVAAERAVLAPYMPSQMSESEIESFALARKGEGMDMGKIMAALKAERPGGYDGKLASAVVKRVLAS